MEFQNSLKPDYLLSPANIPATLDVCLRHLPTAWLQSGIGYGDDLCLLELASRTPLYLYPRLKAGFYYHLLDRHFLPGDHAVHILWQEDSSTLNLPISPAPGEPIWMSTFRWGEYNRIVIDRHWACRTFFSGTYSGTTENIDRDDSGNVINYNLAYADPYIDEVVAIHNANNIRRLALSLPTGASSGLQSITLNPPGYSNFIRATHPQYFKKYVNSAPSQTGEWRFTNNGSTLQFYLPTTTVELGEIFYYTQAPVILRTVSSPIMSYGRVTDPLDISKLIRLGTSNGQEHQTFFFTHFPVLVDNSIKVYVESGGNVEEWTYTSSLETADPEDKVFTVDAFFGLLIFGDGVHGAIPPVNANIWASWRAAPYIKYRTQVDTYSGLDINLHPLARNLHYGFLYLTQQVTAINTVALSTNLPILSGNIYGPLYCGTDFTLLTCKVLDQEGQGIGGLEVKLVCEGHAQFGLQPMDTTWYGSTDMSGTIITALHPPNSLMRVITPVDLFDKDGEALNPYLTTTEENDTLTADLSDAHLLLVPDLTYTFLVLDDEEILPYDLGSRQGGRLVLLYTYNTEVDNFVPVFPLSATTTQIQYPASLPTPAQVPALRRFLIAAPRLVNVYAEVTDPLTRRNIRSNTLTIAVQAPTWQIGPWTLRNFRTQSGASIGTTTYLTLDRHGRLTSLFSISV